MGPVCGLVAVGARPSTSRAKEQAPLRSLGNGTLSIDLPDGFTWSEKTILLPTHIFEKRVYANEPYGKWTVGLSVDEVLANSLADVGGCDQIAQKIAALERAKDGNNSTEVIFSSRGELDGIAADVIEYRADTTRGFYHYLVRVALHNGKLYNYTSQAPENQWPQLEAGAREAMASMRLKM